MRTFILLFLFLNQLLVFSQKYPQDYFKFPIKPGQQNYLSGTLGELRSHHFHSGIDIKTEGRTGLPIYAPADGYVSRIKVSPYGYGKALYIAHPNGYTTVFAHIKNYNETLDKLILNKQYERKSFSVEIFPKKDEIKVSKGDIIAYSGNTGGSLAPHLHFEIRDQAQRPVNPLLFGFNEIKDQTKPSIRKIAIVPKSINSRVNHEFQRVEFTPVSLGNGKYEIKDTIKAYGKIGLELKAFDQLDKASNLNGIVGIETYVNDKPIFSYHVERINFSTSRMMDCHVNYKEMKLNKSYFNKCYIDDGNKLPYYKSKNKGYLTIDSLINYTVKFIVMDAYKNTSELYCHIKGQKPKKTIKKHSYSKKETKITESLHENFLKISVKYPTSFSNTALLTTLNGLHELEPEYYKDNYIVYLWDMRKGLPMLFDICTKKKVFHFKELITPTTDNFSFGNGYSLYFPANALYDTLYFKAKRINNNFSFNYSGIPLLKNITLKFRDPIYEGPKNKTKVFRRDYKKRELFVGGEWKENVISAKTRDFGSFFLKSDITPPKIKRIKENKEDLYFYISDNLTGISKFEAFLNGQWILMNYDLTTGTIWSQRKQPSTKYSGNFILYVTDNCGNIAKFEHSFE